MLHLFTLKQKSGALKGVHKSLKFSIFATLWKNLRMGTNEA